MNRLAMLLLMAAFPVLAMGQQLPEFRVNAVEIRGLNASRTEKMKRAALIFEKVLNDPGFQKELETKTFRSDRKDDLVQNPTARQVIEKIYAAGELYKPEPNNTADIYWYAEKKNFWKRLTRECDSIGYGYPGEKGIFTYTCLIDEEGSMAEVVGNLAHEWSHKLGFVHLAKDHSERHLTVPYVFGDLVEEHAERLIAAGIAR